MNLANISKEHNSLRLKLNSEDILSNHWLLTSRLANDFQKMKDAELKRVSCRQREESKIRQC